MSNLEKDPAEVLLEERPRTSAAGGDASASARLLSPREVPLGGPRAMTVRRTLPQRGRSLIGAWCFLDHYGPDDVAERGGMVVPPHPHTGLQTVSWLFAGEVEHRDSVGSRARVRPGEVNLMTAGLGIQHSEVSTPSTTVLHGAQLWVALPDADRHTAPQFEHFAPTPVQFAGGSVTVFIGSLAGSSSPVRTFSPLLGAQVDLPAGGRLSLEVDPGFEHGVLVDRGDLQVEGEVVPEHALAYFEPGRSALVLEATTAVRLLLIGGTPLGEEIVMWWNFIGRTHEEVVAAREEWQREVVGGADPRGRFGSMDYPGPPLPSPELPTERLRPRA